MTSHQLRVFLAVARHQSFTRAAEALYLTQSAVSQQIVALEREHGVLLFDRLPRRVELTDAGAALLPYAERVGQLLEDATNALDEVRGVARGRLRVGASPTPATYLLPPLLGEFAREHPGLEVVLDVEISARIAQRVAAGEVALGVVEGLAEGAAVAASALVEDELVLVTPPAFVAEGETVSLQELLQLRYLAREPTALTRLLVDSRLRALGVEWTPAMELGNIEAIKRAVAAGLGAAFLSRVAVADEAAVGSVRIWTVAGLALRRPWYLVQRHATRPGPAAGSFAAFLRKRLQTGLALTVGA
jgi:DNA-binding transcriptional LysR family regulator